MKYFDDVVIGDHAIFPEKYLLSDENIIEVGAEWDPIPIHVDKEAAKNSYFGGLVASTVHLFAIATKLSRTRKDEWAVISALGITNMLSHAPGKPGDILYGCNTFTDKRVSKSKPNLGVVGYKCELFNQNDQLLFEFSGSALYKLKTD